MKATVGDVITNVCDRSMVRVVDVWWVREYSRYICQVICS